MSKLYSTAPALATEQVQRSERAASENPNNTAHTQHRRHNSLSGRVCTKTVTKSASITDITQKLENIRYDPITLPDRITDATTNVLSCNSRNLHSRDNDEVDSGDDTRRRRLPASSSGRNEQQNTTKDGFSESITNTTTQMMSYDEPDHLQNRFARTPHSTVFNTRHSLHHNSSLPSVVDNSFSEAGCTSGMSSAFSSACPSTVSSPLSTPTRLSPQHQLHPQNRRNHQLHQQQQQSSCCQKSIAPAKNSCSSATLSSHNNSQHNNHHNHPHLPEHHPDHHQQQQPHKASSFGLVTVSGSKNLKKFDPRLGPSPYRQLLPIALCILSFATVFSILIVYMDTTGESIYSLFFI